MLITELANLHFFKKEGNGSACNNFAPTTQWCFSSTLHKLLASGGLIFPHSLQVNKDVLLFTFLNKSEYPTCLCTLYNTERSHISLGNLFYIFSNLDIKAFWTEDLLMWLRRNCYMSDTKLLNCQKLALPFPVCKLVCSQVNHLCFMFPSPLLPVIDLA